MIPFKFSSPTSAVFNLLLLAAWLIYLFHYWKAVVKVLGASKFDSPDKILWFLVLTMAPVLGLITFHAMCPPHVLNAEAVPPPSDPPK
jgi:hypothetical protein